MAPKAGAGKPKSTKGDSKNNKVLGAKVSKKNVKRPPPKEVKSKARTEQSQLKKTKKREYTEAELDLPKLNMITPVGVVNPKGKKKGKTFCDDPEAMMTIFAMVNAEKEGQIESKIMKARQLEEIREAKRKEAEARQSEKKSKLENAKESIRQNRKSKGGASKDSKSNKTAEADSPKPKSSGKKSVAFA
ncbi:protein loc1 [Aspergillus undulatus]|uniref:protein loc1 n=1 Tax=Aspergillus undulatus TaxID=1810928 RepID=UPI003CCD2E82